jgi:hypothetical protein
MAAPTCTGCRERDRLVADLRHRISQLETQVERLTGQLQQAQRDGKRQAAPFAKGPPKPEPKRPGRKAGPGRGTAPAQLCGAIRSPVLKFSISAPPTSRRRLPSGAPGRPCGASGPRGLPVARPLVANQRFITRRPGANRGRGC